MKRQLFRSTFFLLIFLTLSTLSQTVAANSNAGEQRIVRLFYFLPNDRTYKAYIVEEMRTGILEVQSFYREQMEAHGHGAKTFQIETDAQGTPIVHRVDGDHSNSHYVKRGRPENEISRAFDTSSIVHFIVMDISTSSGGQGVGIKQRGMGIIYGRWNTDSAAHELGHAFGLQHDFRDDTYIMSYGDNPNSLSACAAHFLAVNPYFNQSIPLLQGLVPSVQLTSSTQYSYGVESVPVTVRVQDPDGLQQVSLFVKTPEGAGFRRPSGFLEIKACQNLSGQTAATVTFNYDGNAPFDDDTSLLNQLQHTIHVSAVDKQGNRVDSPHSWTLQAINIKAAKVPVSQRSPAVRNSIYNNVRIFLDRSVSSYDHITDAHLAEITTLYVNDLHWRDAPLKYGDFDGLTNLSTLELRASEYGWGREILPYGIFEGLTSLSRFTTVYRRRTTFQFKYPVWLEKVGEGQFKAVVPNGALFDIVLPLRLANGSIEGGATSTTIPKGSRESALLTVTRTPGTTLPVSVRIAGLPTLPSLPSRHAGYNFITAHYSDQKSFAVVIFDALPGAPKPVNERTPEVHNAIVKAAGIETPNVGKEIEVLFVIGWVDQTLDYNYYAAFVTEAHLAAITSLDISNAGITELKPGDFDDLPNLTEINLRGNQLSLQTGIFDGLNNLTVLNLASNDLSSLPKGIFDELNNLTTLNLASNELSSLIPTIVGGIPDIPFFRKPSAIFDELTNLTTLNLASNELSALPAGVFDELTNLTSLSIGGNDLSSLSEDIFDELTRVTKLDLTSNDLSSLPAGIFDQLTNLISLDLSYNDLNSLPADIFNNPTDLIWIDLSDNQLHTLPPDIFHNLTSLIVLSLSGNQLSSLPARIFEGLFDVDEHTVRTLITRLSLADSNALASWRVLNLTGNTVDPLPLTISLVHVTDDQFKAVAPVGAPFDIMLPITVINGNITGGATTITIPTGSVDSQPLTVIRTPSIADAVTVDIGDSLPNLPPNHQGYALVKSDDLPIVFTEPSDVLTPVSDRTPEVRDAIVAKVPSIDSAEDVTAAHLAAITGMDVTLGTSLKAGDFNGLTGMTELALVTGELTSLPVGVFNELTNLTVLEMEVQQSISFPAGVFNGLSNLTHMVIHNEEGKTITLSAGTFDGLTNLTYLVLRGDQGSELAPLPAGVFDSLTNLETLGIIETQLTSLPDGLFFGLSSLTVLRLSLIGVDSLPLTVSLEKIGTDQFRAVMPTGAPFEVVLSVSIENGSITSGVTTLTIPRGAVESETLTVTRTPGTTYAVSVNIAALPGLPSGHRGYTLVKSAELPLEFGELGGRVFTPVSERTPQVQNAILNRLPDIDSVNKVTRAHLAGITRLGLGTLSLFGNQSDPAIAGATSLKLGDFDGLTSLTTLMIIEVNLSTIPAGVFDDLIMLETLFLIGNYSSLPSGVFDELTSLTLLNVGSARLNSLPADIFDKLIALETLIMGGIFSNLPDDVFDELTTLTKLSIISHQLRSLPADIFDKLTALTILALGIFDTSQFTLPAGIFEGLTMLTDFSIAREAGDRSQFTVSLQKVGQDQVKAVAPTGAPFDIVLPIATTKGSVGFGATSITIPTGRVESEPLTVTRFPGTTGAVTVDIGTVPRIPNSHDGYALVKSETLPLAFTEQLTEFLPVSERTPQGAAGILGVVKSNDPSITTYDQITVTHLAKITALDLSNKNITSLKSGDFDGLTGMNELRLNNNTLASLPADIFSGLSSMTTLHLNNNDLTNLPVDIFSGLSSMINLDLGFNQFSTLPRNIFSGLRSLRNLNLADNPFNSLPAGIFSGLSFNTLGLSFTPGSNLFTSSPGLFSGLGSLGGFTLSPGSFTFPVSPGGAAGRPGDDSESDSLSLILSLEKVGERQFKAVAPTGVPFAIVLPISITNGSINGGATTITIPIGSTESEILTVTRTPGTTGAVLVDIGTLPGLPSNHAGYTLIKSNNLPLAITSGTNEAPMFTEGTNTTRTIAENTAANVNIGTAITATDADNNTLTYTLGGTDAASFSIVSTSGQLKTSAALDYETKSTYTITVTVSDDNLTDTITVTITVTDAAETPIVSTLTPVCDRTPQVRDAIVAAFSGVSDCNDVTEAHLAAIKTLNLIDKSITSLKDGDFDGLSALTTLYLHRNQITTLSAGVFDGLSVLTQLELDNNQLTSLPAGVFDGLSSLTVLGLSGNQLTSLPVGTFDELSSLTNLVLNNNQLTSLAAGVFDGLSALTYLQLQNNQLTSLPADVFDELSSLIDLHLQNNQLTSLSVGAFNGLSSLTQLLLNDNQLTSLSVGVFNGLPALTQLWLQNNQLTSLSVGAFGGLSALKELYLDSNGLTSLPIGVFDGLSSLTGLLLNNNEFTSLPAGVFDGLSALTRLHLHNNQLSSLLAGVFDGLSVLTTLHLHNNQLTSLSASVFDGLSALTRLSLHGNAVDLLPLTVSLEKIVDGQFKATAPTGAPFDIVLPVSITNGSISGGTTNITIPKGSVESGTLTVIRTPGTTAAVTVDISTLPGLPANHQGYALVKSINLPLELISSTGNRAPVFTDGASTIRTVPENTAANVNIGNAIPATDANNDTLTYTLGGTDASSFSIDSTTGQLQTKSALDYETKSTYTVIVTVSDGSLTGTITVTINITVVAETSTATTAVNIPDTNLRAKIETALGKASGAPISAAEMATLTSLSAQDASISDLTGLEAATNLTTLNLGNNSVSDISALTGLTKLTELQLWDNNISNISAVAKLTQLTRLYLWGNAISDIYPVAGLTNLTRLYLGENSISNISAVSGLKKLTHLYLNENSLSNISAIVGLTNLTELRIGDNTIWDISAVVNLSKLVWLDARNNTISDITALTYLTNLTTLTLTNNNISNISATTYLTKLIEVFLNENSISDILPLVSNTGLGENTEIDVRGNPLSYPSIHTHIPALQARNVYIDFDNRVATAPMKISGDSQQGPPGTALTQPFVVEVRDANSIAFVGVPVTFAITAGGGTLSATNPTTGASGRTESTLTLGNTAGTNSVTVSTQGISQTVTFTATAVETTTNTAPVFTDGSSATRVVELSPKTEGPEGDIDVGSPIFATDTDGDHLTYTLGGADANFFHTYVFRQDDTTVGLQLTTRGWSLHDGPKSTYTVTVTVSDGSLTDTITVIINVTDVADTPVTPTSSLVCDRTPQVRDAIVGAVPSVNDCRNVTEAHLRAITSLDLHDKSITSLKAGDFSGLSSLRTLYLNQNQLQQLPEDLFSGLSSLRDLYLNQNQLSSLPETLFSGLSALRQINLHTNRLTSLPADLFSGLSSLTQLFLRNNRLASLPADVFSGLSSLQYLYLDGNRLTSLPADLFSGLPSLTQLLLNNNQMSTLSAEMFRGFTASSWLWLQGNPVDPLPLTVSLEKVGTSQFKATVPAGAPFTFTLPLLVANGTISGGASTLTIPQGSVESGRLTVTRTTGTTAAVTVDIGTLPGLPANHQGYQLARSTDLPLVIFDSAANSAPVFTEGASTTRSVMENTASNVNIGAAIAATDADNDTLTYTRGGTDAASFSIVNTSGQLKTSAALDYETKRSYTVTVTVSDASLTDTITVIINVTDVAETPADAGVCKVGDVLAPGESCTYPDTDATFSVLANGDARWNIPDLPSWLAWINQTSIGGSMSISATVNDQAYHFVAAEVSNDSWEIKEIGDDRTEQPETPEQPEQPGDTGVTPTLTVSTTSPLTEATLDESTVTLNLSGGTYESTAFDIRRSLTVSGITGADFETFSVVRVSDTRATVELEFDGNISTNGTLTFNLESDAITNYEGAALTAQISVPAVTESVTASTAAPLTEATLDESVVTLTLSGRKFEQRNSRIRGAVSVSGISGVTARSFDIDRVNDTQVTVELTFDGNINTDSTLTFTVGAGAIAGYNGTALTAQVSVSASADAPTVTDPQTPQQPQPPGGGTPTLSVTTTSPLTEATLHGGVVTLTLSDGTYESTAFDIRRSLTVSGITGADFETFSVVRVSDTQATVELEFDGNISTSGTLTFNLESDAITNYEGAALTSQISVPAVTESIAASTDAPLTEASLDESVVTLTLSGRKFEQWNSRIRGAVSVSGISGVTVRSFDIDRVNDTQVTVELTFSGNISTDSTLTFTVGTGAIAGYNGPALTAQVPVSASTEAPEDTGGTPPVTEVAPLGICQVGNVLAPGESCTYPGTDTEFSVLNDGRGQFGFFTSGSNLNIINTTINGVVYTLVAQKLASGSWEIEQIGDSSTQQPETPQQPEQPGDTGATPTLTASTPAPLTEVTLDESVVTLTLTGRNYVDWRWDIERAVTVSGIDGVKKESVRRISNTKVTVELEFNGDFDANATLTFTVKAGAIADYNGPAFTQQIPVTGGHESIVASTKAPLTEITLNGSIVTLTLTGRNYVDWRWDIKRAVTVSGIDGVTKEEVIRISNTKVTVELEFNGDFDADATLTFTVKAGAIADYNGPAFTQQIPVTGGHESIVASTKAPLTEITLNGSIVTLTLTGRNYVDWRWDIKRAVTVSGIDGVTKEEVIRISNTKVTVELEFNGDFDADATLTFTVKAGAIADYNGPAFTQQIPVTGGHESIVASTKAPLTEITLNGSIVTLTLTGRNYVDWRWDIERAVTVSGINGVTKEEVRRISNTKVTVELEFNGDFDADATLTFTVGPGTIADYNGPAFTQQIPVTGGPESITASTADPLTEATLDEGIVTLTLTGRNYVDSRWDISRALTITGIDGVKKERVNRISKTKVTVKLEFNGDFDADATLTFTVGPGAIADYNGPALTAQITVAASQQVLKAPSGISLMHVPLHVTAINGVPKTIESVGDLYNALGGADAVNLLITHDPETQVWHSYLGEPSRGTVADTILADHQGIIADMKTPVSLQLDGDALGSNGSSSITLHPGTNLVGVPLRDPRITRVSDLFALEGIGGNVPAITVLNNGTFQTVKQAGDAGDISITGGQSFILNAREATTAAISGQGWDNVSGVAAAPSTAVTGIKVGDTTPILALRGSIASPVGGWGRMPHPPTVGVGSPCYRQEPLNRQSSQYGTQICVLYCNRR